MYNRTSILVRGQIKETTRVYTPAHCTATDLVTPANLGPSTATDEPTRKKKKRSALMELIRNKFQSENEKINDTTTFKDIVQSELLHYKTEPLISVYRPPLHWWSAHQHLYPNMSKLACKYLCIVATSVPSE